MGNLHVRYVKFWLWEVLGATVLFQVCFSNFFLLKSS